MGAGTWDSASRDTYREFADSTRGKSTAQVYTSRSIDPDLDPLKVKNGIRESRDSSHNPASTPIIVALDVTGSMGILADTIARQGLGTLFESILERKPVTDPHLMFMAIGDANYDSSPLQVSQFEADRRIIDQLTKIYLEHGGGGNNFESYNLAWYFATFHTQHDALQKRGERGFLFTVGDEQAPEPLTIEQIRSVVGDDTQRVIPTDELLKLCEGAYHVFHIVAEQGSHVRHGHRDAVYESWNALLGQRVIPMTDHTKLAEIVVSAIQVAVGADASAVAGSWADASTQQAVAAAVSNLAPVAAPAPAAAASP